jgi:hypothetical protein
MRLLQIDVCGEDGLKGRNFREQLSGCDVFCGPNGIGKSARLIAIQAAIQGLAETPADAVRAYLGPDLPDATVELLFERDGEQVCFTRDLHAKQATKEAKIRNAQAADLVGSAPTRWDLDDFAKATDGGRRQVLDAVCRAAGALGDWTGLRVRTELQECEEAAPAVRDLLELYPLQDVDDLGAWLPTALNWAREEYTKTNAAQKQAAGHAAEAAKAAEVAVDGDLEEARAALAVAEDARRSGGELVAAAEAQRRLVLAHKAEGDLRHQSVARAKSEYTAAAEANTKASDEVVAAGGRLSAAMQLAPPEDRTPELRAKVAEAKARLDTMKRSTTTARDGLSAARQGETRARGYVETIRKLAQATSEAGPPVCAHCGGADPLGLAAGIDLAQEAVGQAAQAVEDAAARLKIAEVRERQATMLVDAATGELTMAQVALSSRVQVAPLEEEAKRAGARLLATREAQDRAGIRLNEAEKELAAWSKRPAPTEPEGVAVDLVELDRAVRDARAVVEAHVRHAEVVRQAERAQLAADSATAAWDATRALGAELKRLQGEIAQAAYRPICETAGVLLDRAGLAWQIEIRSESDLGARIDGTYRPLWALSDSERALVGMSLAVAFARLSDLPWKACIVDRLEALDGERLPRVLTALGQLVAEGWIDNFVGALVGDPFRVPECEMHLVSSPVRAVA